MRQVVDVPRYLFGIAARPGGTPHGSSPPQAIARTDNYSGDSVRYPLDRRAGSRQIVRALLTPELVIKHQLQQGKALEDHGALGLCASNEIPMALTGPAPIASESLPSPPTSSQAGLHPAGLSWGSSSAGLEVFMHFASPDLIQSSSCRATESVLPCLRCHLAQEQDRRHPSVLDDSLSAPDFPALDASKGHERPFAQTLCPSSRPAGLCVLSRLAR